MIGAAVAGLVVTGVVATVMTFVMWKWWSDDPLNLDLERWTRSDVVCALRPWISIAAGVLTVAALRGWL